MKSMMLAASAAALVPLAVAQDLCDQYAYHSEAGYYVNNNEWGSGSGSGDQCTHIDSISSDGVSWWTEWSWSGGENNVKAYPYSGVEIEPRLVSDISNMPSKAEWGYQGGDVRANVAYDLFTAADPNHDTSSGDYELMIWLANLGGVYPIGSSVGQVTIGDTQWELYDGYNGDMHVYSFVTTGQVDVFEQDVKSFYNHLTDAMGFPASSQYLITFQFGTEPFTGTNARFDTWYWYGQVN